VCGPRKWQQVGEHMGELGLVFEECVERKVGMEGKGSRGGNKEDDKVSSSNDVRVW